MRLFKITIAIWSTENWKANFKIKDNWKKKEFWFLKVVKKPAFSVTLGPIRFDGKAEGKLDGR